jgi:glycosyltransferase involved in cell wall biosynthesis
MRRSDLTIVNDESRVELQRAYVGLASTSPVLVYPGCFREPPAPGDRGVLRAELGIPPEAPVLTYSGVFGAQLGIPWMLEALEAQPDLHVLAQFVNLDPLTRSILERTRASERLHMTERRLSWSESWASMAAADIGVAVYHHPGPQFQNMGTSSNRLCMYLSMGLPVVASRQGSFEFLERFDCGVLVDTEADLVAAVARIRSRLPEMSRNARRCAREYVDAAGRYRGLVRAVAALTRSAEPRAERSDRPVAAAAEERSS